MIVKILSSAKNFSGVNYNEKKNDLGESELLRAENFGGLSYQTDLTRADYLNYMKAIGSLNSRVKNKQFHAVISVKGKSSTLDKLLDVGVQYLEKMGYGKNPYLIYHHADTANTHIHLVSTRVDKNGRKVDDSFEKLRSQKVMHEILSRDPLYEADTSISNAMKYNFSTEAQFKLLLELQGFTIREIEANSSEQSRSLEIIKYGVVQRIINPDTITKRMNEYRFPDQRVRQIKALFLKYAVGLSEDQWTSLMKEKFGIDLVFHRKHVNIKPYGYTVVDHNQQNVFKGSQVIRLSELQATASEEKVNKLINELACQPGLSFSKLQLELEKIGLKLNQKGVVRFRLDQAQLPRNLYLRLKYQDRLTMASSFKINDSSCKTVLGKLIQVEPSSIGSSVGNAKSFEAIKAVVTYLEHQQKWKKGLDHFNFSLIRHQDTVFLLSAAEPALVRLDKLMGSSIAIGEEHLTALEAIIEPLMNHNVLHHSSKDSLLSVLFDMLAESQQKTQDQKNKKKRNKSI